MAGLLSHVSYGAIGFTRGFVPHIMARDDNDTYIIKSKPEVCVPVSIVAGGIYSLGYFMAGKLITIGVRDVYHPRIKVAAILLATIKIADDVIYKIDEDSGKLQLKYIKSRFFQ